MTIAGVSGGRTSAYIAANYPADVLLFSLVCVDDSRCASPDPMLMRYANDKIAKYCASFGEVIGTAEDPVIFKTMFELEQFLGKEIVWVRGLSFDQIIQKKKALPIKQKRWCTTFLKIEPSFWYWFSFLGPEKAGFYVGYRYDEKEREGDFSTRWTYADYCRLGAVRNKQHLVHDLEWRYGMFPLIEDRVTRPRVNTFWRGKPVSFAEDSNCQHCIFKQRQQVRRNFERNPQQINWAQRVEDGKKFNWHHDYSIRAAKSDGIDMEFAFGDSDAGCSAGECSS